jgi:hypothetical protein
MKKWMKLVPVIAVVVLVLATMAPVFAASKWRNFAASWGTSWSEQGQAMVGAVSTTRDDPQGLRIVVDSKWGEGPITVMWSCECWDEEAKPAGGAYVEGKFTGFPKLVKRIDEIDVEKFTRCYLAAQGFRANGSEDRIQIGTEGHLKIKLQVDY